jgi:hypothetical protein
LRSKVIFLPLTCRTVTALGLLPALPYEKGSRALVAYLSYWKYRDCFLREG